MLLENLTCWFAIQVKPQMERFVASVLRIKGYDEFLPLYCPPNRVRRKNSTLLDSLSPLFPGYVFCHFDSSVKAPIVTTPGVIQILGVGKRPIAIDDAEIENLRRVVLHADRQLQPLQNVVSAGELVEIIAGPLRGCQGMLERVKDSHRFIVMVSLLRRSVAIEIEAECVLPVDPQMQATGRGEAGNRTSALERNTLGPGSQLVTCGRLPIGR